MMKNLFLLLILSLLATPTFIAQDAPSTVDSENPAATGDENKADQYFFDEDYKAALKEYLLLLDEDPEDLKYNFNTGLCYLNADFDQIKAIPYFEKVVFYDEVRRGNLIKEVDININPKLKPVD